MCATRSIGIPSATLNGSIRIPGLTLGGKARVYSYGIPQDKAARIGEDLADVQQSKHWIAGSTLSYSPASYSATVIDIEIHDGEASDDDLQAGESITDVVPIGKMTRPGGRSVRCKLSSMNK